MRVKCTEGDKNQPEFKIGINSSFGDDPPNVTLIIPDNCWPDDEYDEYGFPENEYKGEGVFKVDLKSVLEEYITEELDESNAHELSSILREYADKIDNAVISMRGGKA